MNKCIEHLAFIDCKTGKIKIRFELALDQVENLEGRRPQLIKKIVGHGIEKGWIKPRQLFAYLKQKKLITVLDLIAYAYSNEE